MKKKEISGEDIRALFRNALQEYYPTREIDNIVTWLFEFYLHWNRADSQIRKNQALAAEHQRLFEKALERLRRGEPIQYIIGATWFCGLRMEVNPAVLIPRPETEELAMIIVNDFRNRSGEIPCILDIGTGSGCIAVALKFYLPHCHITGVDNHEDALEIARRNATCHNLSVSFRKFDILNHPRVQKRKSFDAIVSNPPYIPGREKQQMPRHVAGSEPDSALFVPDEDPLLFYRAIARFAHQTMKPSGKVYVEIHERFGAETLALFREAGFRNAEVIQDLHKKNRFIRASDPEK